jgi:hypothetical protein
VQTLKFLHRGDGAVVTLHRKLLDKPFWQDLGGSAIADLDANWVQVANHVGRDSYFSINSTHNHRTMQVSDVTGLPIYARRVENLRWLNCVFVDCDVYKSQERPNLDKVLEELAFEIDRSGLPRPSAICSSGRGVWSLWLLRDHSNHGTPVPASLERQDIFQRVNQALVARFAKLGADPACTDTPRVMRIPDSINTRAALENQIVRFFPLSEDRHSLPELANALGVTAHKVHLPGGRRTAPKNAAKVKAGRARWRVPLEGFCRLWKMRGEFAINTRRFAVYIYAGLLRRNRIPETEIEKECLRLAKSCSPALTANDVARCVCSSRKLAARPFSRSIRNATMARMLKITDAEKARLPEWFKPKRRSKADQIEERRRLITRELEVPGKSCDGGDAVSSRDMAKLLAEKHGIKVSHVTVLKDLQFLRGQHCEPPVDCATGKVSLLGDSKSPLVPTEKTYQRLSAPMVGKATCPFNGHAP